MILLNYFRKILLILLCIVVLLSYTLYVQINKGSSYYPSSISLYVNKESQNSIRGLILDRNGKILADNQLYYDIYLKFEFENRDNLIKDFKKEYKKSSLPISKLIDDSKLSAFEESDIPIAKKLSQTELDEISEYVSADNYEIKSYFLRNYLYPELFTHTIGYVGEASEEEIDNKTITNGDFVGKYRVESLLDKELRGTKGETINSQGQTFSQDSMDGDNVYLTLDYSWQNNLYNLFENYDNRYSAAGGGGVIIKNSTGEIFADVSYPGFDTNKFVFGIGEAEFNNLSNDRDNPLLDKSVSNAYTPGSIFKIISAYTLLDQEEITPDTTYYSNRCIKLGPSDFCEFGKNFYGEMNLEKALYKSSNLFFCNYMLELEGKGKLDSFIVNAKKFGIGSEFNFIFEDKSIGIMDSPEYKLKQTGDTWFPGDTCNAVIGQGAILVNPLQMARAVSIFENNGSIVQPQLVKEVRSSDATLVKGYAKIDDGTFENFNQSAKDAIYKGLSSVAYSPGSAVFRFLGSQPYNIHAKTGSAETYENIDGQFVERTHSWIIGSFEYEGESYSFAFMQIYGGGGYYISELLGDFLNTL